MKGTVRHIPVEGGAWGIECDDGQKLLPVNLDSEHRVEGLRLRFGFEPVSMASAVQWGRTVRLSEVHPVEPTDSGE